MAAFKDELSPPVVRQLANELSVAWPDFPKRRFTNGLATALEPLELTPRVDHVTGRLLRALPEPFDQAAAVLRAALESPTFDGWMVWPCGAYVATAGIDHPKLALPLLGDLTTRWSSEFAIRPFIVAHPTVTYRQLLRWARDPDEHRRRLASEGTRPRLPWAPVLRSLVVDPSPNLPILDALVDDPSATVRRSVANHLNDITKDNPEVALRLAESWLDRGGDSAAWVVRHGLRTLVKRGDERALRLIGVETDAAITLDDFVVAPAHVAIGGAVELRGNLTLTGAAATDAVIDYRVHYMGAKGPKPPKVFKLTRRRLEPGVSEPISTSHRFEHVSIRQIRPGPHTIDLQVNGRVLGARVIDVTAADS